MIEWMTAHPWMTFTVLVLFASSFRFTFTLPIGLGDQDDGKVSDDDRPLVTPDEARLHMLTPRELAAKTVADAIDEFCEDGDPNATIDSSGIRDADIAELIRYRDAGWSVRFERDQATISLPAVLS